MAGNAMGRDSPGTRSPESTRDTAGAEETLLRTLRRCKLFESVPTQELLTILALGREWYVPKRATMFRQGDRAGSIYAVIQGKVKLLLTGQSGRGIILSFVEAGESFGVLAPMAGTAQAYTAQAIAESRVLAWAAETFELSLIHI